MSEENKTTTSELGEERLNNVTGGAHIIDLPGDPGDPGGPGHPPLWNCPGCGRVNRGFESVCARCNATKPA